MNYVVFGAGCFWCVEAIFMQLNGVTDVISGYTGGEIKNPTYEQVCSGTSGHVEVCKITYDPKIISYIDLLKTFFQTHDPTTLDRQGNDIGSQYKSAIYYNNENEKKIANTMIEELNNSNIFKGKIVTIIEEIEL